MGQIFNGQGLRLLALLVAGLALVPIAAVLASFAAPSAGTLAHIAETVLPTYALNSALLMVFTASFAVVVGVGTAWLIASADFRGRQLLSWVLVLPIAAPAYIIAYLYTDLLTYSGPLQGTLRSLFKWSAEDYWFPEIRSLPGAALMLGLVLYPYVYLLARAAFSLQSRSQFIAARTLGLTPVQAFARVALPAARPAIFGGAILVMMETLADFGVAEYFAIPTFSTGIFRTWFALGDRPGAMQLAGVMLVFVVLLITAEATTRRGKVVSGDRLSDGPRPFRLSPLHTACSWALCGAPVVFGFAVPMGLLVKNIMTQVDGQPFAAVTASLWTSINLALTTAAVATFLAVLLAYAARPGFRSARKLTGGIVRISTLGYALPGALLAIGILGPLSGLDVTVTRFLRDILGWQGGLVLTGTATLLIYALTVRFLTVAFNSVSSGFQKLAPSLDAAARSLGASPLRLMTTVHAPLLAPQLAVGAALVFVDVMRELPATLILRPFNFETLATRVYRLAGDERIVEASTPALLIVLAGLLPVLILSRERAGRA